MAAKKTPIAYAIDLQSVKVGDVTIAISEATDKVADDAVKAQEKATAQWLTLAERLHDDGVRFVMLKATPESEPNADVVTLVKRLIYRHFTNSVEWLVKLTGRESVSITLGELALMNDDRIKAHGRNGEPNHESIMVQRRTTQMKAGRYVGLIAGHLANIEGRVRTRKVKEKTPEPPAPVVMTPRQKAYAFLGEAVAFATSADPEKGYGFTTAAQSATWSDAALIMLGVLRSTEKKDDEKKVEKKA